MLTPDQERALENLTCAPCFNGSYKVEPTELGRYKLTALWRGQDPFNALTGIILPNGIIIQRQMVTIDVDAVFGVKLDADGGDL